jgi:hypothetical protein
MPPVNAVLSIVKLAGGCTPMAVGLRVKTTVQLAPDANVTVEGQVDEGPMK